MSQHRHPPVWAQKLLHWYCPVNILEEIEGDLLERFYHRVEEEGLASARQNYSREVLRFCNPITFRKARTYSFTFYPPAHRLAMLRNYFISAVRNLSKDKTYAAINILGLALGVACCVAIFVLVRFETSFDDFHSQADRIYRINLKQQRATGVQRNGYNFYPLGEAIRAEVSGLEAVTSLHHSRNFQFTVGDNIYEGEHAFWVDTAYFSVFDGKWLLGNPKSAFGQPNSVVVTDQFAEKYLGGLDKAMDTTFIFHNQVTLRVNGILEAPPHNTDMPYEMLMSYSSVPIYLPESIDNYDYNSFTYDFPVPLMLVLSIVAGLIAFIACINFINLATAQSLTRAREVGIRQTMGSSRVQLILQYLSEAFVLTLVAVVLGLILAKIPLQLMNAERGYSYLRFSFFQDGSMIVFVVGITLFITLLAGFYPAFVLSGFPPVKALKGKISTGKPKGFNLRRGLVVAQFLGAQILILVTATVVYQLNHLRERPLGFDTETMVFTVLPDTTRNLSTFKQRLLQNPNVQNLAFGWGGPRLNAGGVQFYGEAGEDFKTPGVIHYGDEQYIAIFERTLLAGTNFSGDRGNPVSEVIVNQTLVRALGIDSPEEAVGTIFTLVPPPPSDEEEEVMIRGVINDVYTNALSSTIDPLVLQYDPAKFAGVAIKIAPTQVAETLRFIETVWKDTYPEHLMDLRFLDERLDQQYSFFDKVLGFLEPASFLAILIGCMGLYGLISFMAVQRTKEIGIRKVLGASVTKIILLFAQESLLLIIIAFAVAAPLGHLLGQALLMELPERATPGISVFVVTFITSLFIALLTIGYQSFRAASANPADALRYE